ncbi:hypothetical protein [Catellatospora methionotrophica]|uniref:hypothetical protein n=1 Tax=Catellatospora methionotrophica TaxID=121620 RepID=UPI0033F8B114
MNPIPGSYLRTLTPPVLAGEGEQVSAATLSYFGTNVARRLGLTPAALRARLGDAPFVTALMDTPLGRTAIFTLPLTYRDMVRDDATTVHYAQAAIAQARAMGAGHVSLAGLLASATGYGRLLDAPDGTLTTGHATTVAAIVRTVEHVLDVSARHWAHEAVTVLGLGSIGQATVTATLATLGAPRRLVLSDLPGKRAAVEQFADRLRQELPGLEVAVADATAPGDHGHRAGLVIGCTSTPNALDVDRLAPGCIIVDDSVPHCFDVGRAYARVDAAADLLLANGGLLALAEPFPVRSYAPPLLHELGWNAGVHHDRTITSCILSPLLMAAEPELPATLGMGVPVPTVVANLAVLDRLAVTAPPIRCAGRAPDAAYLARFAERFGTAPAADPPARAPGAVTAAGPAAPNH